MFQKLVVRHPCLFCNGLRRIKTSQKTLYLTFDDGPDKHVTKEVLDILDRYNAKAVFFCVGKKARKYPEILQQIKDAGHTIGNHSYSHLNLFKVGSKKWLTDVLTDSPVKDSVFFRPPYGNITPFQSIKLSKTYKIVLWDVLTYDYRTDFSVDKIKNIIKNNVRAGSIILFHDTQLAYPNMLPSLVWLLEEYSKKNYKFESLKAL